MPPIFPEKPPTKLLCRGCLATDTRLYDMRQNQLMEAYTTLLSSAVQVTDELPHYLCSYCAALLLKCDTFRNKCIDALSAFRNTQLYNLDLCKIYIPGHYVQTCIATIDFIDDKLKIFPDFHETDNREEIKVEIDTCKVKTTDDDIKPKSKSTIKKNIKETDLKNEGTTDLNKTLKVEDLDENYSKIDESDIEISNDDSNVLVSVDTDNDDDIKDIKVESKPKRKKLKVTKSLDSVISKVAKKKKVKMKCNNKKTEFTDNLSETYNINTVELSREEQLKEIEDRKETDNYKLGNFKCNICYKGFIIEETYKNHMLLHDNISGKYVCDICQYHFMSKLKLGFHKGNHKKRYTCKDCGFVTKYLHKVKEHHKWHGGFKYKCKHCEKEFVSTSNYYGHLKVNHPTSDELVRCEICGDAFYGRSGLNFHEKKAHKEMRSPECYCSGCDTQFYCSDAFKAHQGADELCDPQDNTCVRCGMPFETEQLLKEHEIEQQKPRDEFECVQCNKSFKSYQKYNWHRKYTNLHSLSYTPRPREQNNKNIICEICGKVVKNKGLLKVHHRLKHTNERPFQCNECPKNFQCAVNLQIHMRTHTGERPFHCLNCPKAFKTIQNLIRHNLVHSGERPHSCDVCGKTFKTTSDAKTHVKTVHMRIPLPPRIRRRNKKTE